MRVSLALSFSLSALIASTGAMAGPVSIGAGGAVHLLPGQIQAGYRQNLDLLRHDALDQQQRDGGTLTAEHRATVERRLDRINDDYRRMLMNQNPLSVNADGSNVSRASVPANWTVTSLMQTGTQH